MKLNYLSALMLTVAVVFCSCSISEIESIEKPAEKEVTATVVGGPQKMMAQSGSDSLNFDQVKALLDQMGYNTQTLTEYDDYYLIYSDLLFPKSQCIIYRMCICPFWSLADKVFI